MDMDRGRHHPVSFSLVLLRNQNKLAIHRPTDPDRHLAVWNIQRQGSVRVCTIILRIGFAHEDFRYIVRSGAPHRSFEKVEGELDLAQWWSALSRQLEHIGEVLICAHRALLITIGTVHPS